MNNMTTDLPAGVVSLAEALDQLANTRPALSAWQTESLEDRTEETTDAS
jgi:hypothetical protein